jgi:hypothetical protein
MKKGWKMGIIVLAGALALSTGIGIALAKSANGASTIQAGYYAASDNGQFANETVNQWYCGGSGLMGGFLTPQLATLLGTTPADLKAELGSGKTLADLAAAKNVSQQQLVETMMGPYADHLAMMVKYGYLTQTQADDLAQQARTRLQSVVTSQFQLNNGFLGMGGMMRGWFNRTQPGASTPNDSDSSYGGCLGTGPNGQAPAGNGTGSGYGRGMMGRW